MQYFPGKFVNADLDNLVGERTRRHRAERTVNTIGFGSRVDVCLPLTANVKVSIGDKVSATTTIPAQL